jgi:hypothetical protein
MLTTIVYIKIPDYYCNTNNSSIYTYIYCTFSPLFHVVSGSLTPRDGASSGCGRRNGLQYGV